MARAASAVAEQLHHPSSATRSTSTDRVPARVACALLSHAAEDAHAASGADGQGTTVAQTIMLRALRQALEGLSTRMQDGAWWPSHTHDGGEGAQQAAEHEAVADLCGLVRSMAVLG